VIYIGDDVDISNRPDEITVLDFSLLLVCRQIYAETACLPYSCNEFSFSCYLSRDEWASLLCDARWEAIRSVQIEGPCLIDGIDNDGGCQDEIEGPVTPFSTIFPNLRRIGVSADPNRPGKNRTVDMFEHMARQAGMADWVEWVQLKERADVEVVELSLLGVPI